jgi:DNA ligase-1
LDPGVLAQRLMGAWHPDQVTWEDLLAGEGQQEGAGPAYPFFLAHPLPDAPEALPGGPSAWSAEWKWDGIRVQYLQRHGHHAIWTRGEELVTPAFPEFALLPGVLPDGTVLDGELLAWKDDAPLPFQDLQVRLGRKHASREALRKSPVLLMAYDVLEFGGEDLRERPATERRRLLEQLVQKAALPAILRSSPILPFADWNDLSAWRDQSRSKGTEGLMIKRSDSSYRVGRPRGDWWKWKVDPYTVDAVLIYAQRGRGRRAGLYTDFTFGVWRGQELIPFAKAYSGLTDAEIREIDAWMRQHTLASHGPVRVLEPVHVFELAFEGIARSKRHRAGLALRFPRIHRWRRDKLASEADTLATLEWLLEREQPRPPLPQTGSLFPEGDSQ